MTLRSISNNIEKTEDNESQGVIEDLLLYMKGQISYTAISSNRLKAYHLDEINTRMVKGIRLFYFDNDFVAIGERSDKGLEIYRWVSTDAFEKVRDYVYSYFKDEMPMLDIINLDKEITLKVNNNDI